MWANRSACRWNDRHWARRLDLHGRFRLLKASLRSLRGSLPTSDWYRSGQDEGGNSILSIPPTSLLNLKFLHTTPGGGGVLPRILDRGVPRRFVNPNPIKGLTKRKLIPFLRPKAEKWHPIQGKNKLISSMKRKTLFLLCNIGCIASRIKY